MTPGAAAAAHLRDIVSLLLLDVSVAPSVTQWSILTVDGNGVTAGGGGMQRGQLPPVNFGLSKNGRPKMRHLRPEAPF